MSVTAAPVTCTRSAAARRSDSSCDPASITTEQYDESVRRLEKSGDWLPEGLEFHVAFESGGKFRVSEIWDSQAQFDAFGKRLMPVLEDIGIDPGAPELLEIHNITRR